MSELKHTPGEWRAVTLGGSSTVVSSHMAPRNDRRTTVSYGYRGDEFCIAAPFLEEDGFPRLDFVCFAHDDARIISAAPDMYAAIKSFLPSKIDSGNRSVPDDIVIPLDVTIGELRRLEAAIAKAEGRS